VIDLSQCRTGRILIHKETFDKLVEEEKRRAVRRREENQNEKTDARNKGVIKHSAKQAT
jgi:hypothetical protein